MFGGAGVYADELMFALLDRDETIYLRVDAETRPAFEAAGSGAFSYRLKTGEVMELGYWRIPEEALESPEDAARWGRLALAAARRKKAEKGQAALEPWSPAWGDDGADQAASLSLRGAAVTRLRPARLES